MRQDSDTHRVIKGRRWRVTDPALDEPTRQHLVDELMHARRAVKASLAATDSTAEEIARSRVHDAKVALGERGPKWWEPTTSDEIEQRVRAFVSALGTRLTDIDEQQARVLLRMSDYAEPRPPSTPASTAE